MMLTQAGIEQHNPNYDLNISIILDYDYLSLSQLLQIVLCPRK